MVLNCCIPKTLYDWIKYYWIIEDRFYFLTDIFIFIYSCFDEVLLMNYLYLLFVSKMAQRMIYYIHFCKTFLIKASLSVNWEDPK
jgi:hypothetical protein